MNENLQKLIGGNKLVEISRNMLENNTVDDVYQSNQQPNLYLQSGYNAFVQPMNTEDMYDCMQEFPGNEVSTIKDKQEYTYCPEVCGGRDESNRPCTFVQEKTKGSFIENGEDKCTGRISRNFTEYKRNYKILGMFFIMTVTEYENSYMINVEFLNAKNNIEKRFVEISKESCKDYKICEEMKEKGITCFNANLSCLYISRLLATHIESLAQTGVKIPKREGFGRINDKMEFISYEVCQKYGIPIITTEFFDKEIKETSQAIAENFIMAMNLYGDFMLGLLLNMIRIVALIATPMKELGISFEKIIVLSGEKCKISPYFQIYNRNIRDMDIVSLNTSPSKFQVMDKKDNIILYEDEFGATQHKSANAEQNLKKLVNKFKETACSADNTLGASINCLISERLGQMLSGKEVVIIDGRVLPDLSASLLRETFYNLDKLIICDATGNYEMFSDFLKMSYLKYFEVSENVYKYSETQKAFSVLMTAYEVIKRQIFIYGNLPFTESEIAVYVQKILVDSENIDDCNSVVKEFQKILNEMICSEEMELLFNLQINNSFGSDSTKPVIYIDDKLIYIPNDEFELICSRMILTSSSCQVRKMLSSESLLITNDSKGLKYKAVIYGGKYCGTIPTTALQVSFISDAARGAYLGGSFNYKPCRNSEDRVLLGIDEHNIPVYTKIQGSVSVFGLSGENIDSIITRFTDYKCVVFKEHTEGNVSDKLVSIEQAEPKQKLIIVIPESHNLDFKKDQRLRSFIANKNSSDVILIFVYSDFQISTLQTEVLCSSDIKVIAEDCPKTVAEKVVKVMGFKSICKFTDMINGLSYNEYLVIGKLEDDSGSIDKGRFIKVRV